MFASHISDFVDWQAACSIYDESLKVLGTEVKFSAVMPAGNRWSGYVDCIYYRENDDGTRTIYIVDWKTCSAVPSADFVPLDSQLAGYSELFKYSDLYQDGDEILVAFGAFKKNKSGGFIPPDFKPVTDAAIEAFYGGIDAAIALRSIPPVRMSASGYNTPCRMCDFNKLCRTGEDDSLLKSD